MNVTNARLLSALLLNDQSQVHEKRHETTQTDSDKRTVLISIWFLWLSKIFCKFHCIVNFYHSIKENAS